MIQPVERLQQSVLTDARKKISTLSQDFTAQQALDAIRRTGTDDRPVYFYVTDDDKRLVGVLPVRRLLEAAPERNISELMIRHVVMLPEDATVVDALEMFVLHRFLALPVVNAKKQLLGVVDVGLFTNDVLNVAERPRVDELFEAFGFHIAQARGAGPLRAFRFRFPWLLATIASGTGCAILASLFELTLAKSIVLAFFLTMVLGLAESVSIQSMTMTIQALQTAEAKLGWYTRTLRREAWTALMLGTVTGSIVGLLVWVWRGTGMIAVAIGSSIALALCAACFFGLTVPALLHALKLDPKISAGPVTLACTDLFTLLFYFAMAAWLI